MYSDAKKKKVLNKLANGVKATKLSKAEWAAFAESSQDLLNSFLAPPGRTDKLKSGVPRGWPAEKNADGQSNLSASVQPGERLKTLRWLPRI
jgi:hypothetical protein